MSKKIGIYLGIAVFLVLAAPIAKSDSQEGSGNTSFYGVYPRISGKTKVSTKTIEAKKDQNFQDKWTLEGLRPSHQYTITTQEYDVAEDKVISEDFKGQLTFIAKDDTQAVDVSISGDATKHGGHRLVTVGTVKDESGIVVLNLSNIEDEDETLTVLENKNPIPVPNFVDNAVRRLLPSTGEGKAIYLSVVGLILLAIIGFLVIWKRRKKGDENEQ